jgi:urease accessory protein
MATDIRLLALLHLCDSLFPTGSFAHSDGLETATSAGLVSSAADLREWMDVCLEETLGRFEAQAVWLALNARMRDDWRKLQDLDAEVIALRPSSAARAASRAMGTRLLKMWREIGAEAPDMPETPDLLVRRSSITNTVSEGGKLGPTYRGDRAYCGDRPFSLPVAFGIVCASIGVDARAAVEAFIYTRLASIASSAMRLMPIGQREAHVALAAMLTRVPGVVDAIALRCERAEPLGAFAPALDLATMGQQHVRSRLFLS